MRELPWRDPVDMTTVEKLFQNRFWITKEGQVLEIRDMTDTHRLNLMRMLERNARRYADAVTLSMALGPQPSGDMACDAFESELFAIDRDPLGFIRSTPLYEELACRMPTVDGGKRSRKRWGRMLLRAKHYSTCPRNRNLKAEECTCRRLGELALTASSGLSA